MQRGSNGGALASRPINTLGASTTGSTSGGGLSGGGGEVHLSSSRSTKYPHRLNLYERPPLDELTLEQFEVWAIDRLRRALSPPLLPTCSRPRQSRRRRAGVPPFALYRAAQLTHPHAHAVLADIESAQARNRPFKDVRDLVEKRAAGHLPLHAETSARTIDLDLERKKDLYSHFILRLAFCRSCVSPSLSPTA